MKRSSKAPAQNSSDKKIGATEQVLTFAATPITQSKHTLYLLKASASELYSVISINRRIQEKDEGYQRVLSPGRVQALTKFVLQGQPLPGAIIVSFDKATFKSGKLSVPKGTDVGWVIDGQHRLAGAAMASRLPEGPDIEFPIVAFVGLTEARQVEQFVTINREAKNVPTSLYLDLLRHLPTKKPGDVAKERAADLGTVLRRDEESPFFERIVVTTSPRSGQLSLTNFVRKIAPHVTPDRGILHVYTEQEQLAVISNYFKGLEQVFPEEFGAKDSTFFKTVGFGAVWNVFPTFFSLTLKYNQGFGVKDVVNIFRRVSNFDFDAWRQYGSGNQAELNAGDDFKTALLLATKAEDNAGGALRV